MNTSGDRQCWQTPPELWAQIKKFWNPQIDLAADSTNHLCDCWCGPDHEAPSMRDGLTVNLSNLRYDALYCNPGFTGMGDWCKRVRRETWGGFPLGIVMAMVSPSTAWWNEWAMLADQIILLSPRVQFVPPAGIKPSSNSHDNCLLIYRYGPPTTATTPHFTSWRWKA